MNQVEYAKMAAASSGSAPAVSRKFFSAEFLNNVPSSHPRLSVRRRNGCKQTSRDRDVNAVHVTPKHRLHGEHTSLSQYESKLTVSLCCLTFSSSSLACNCVHELSEVSLGFFPSAVSVWSDWLGCVSRCSCTLITVEQLSSLQVCQIGKFRTGETVTGWLDEGSWNWGGD